MNPERLNFVLATLTLLTHIIIIIGGVLFVVKRKSHFVQKGLALLAKHGLLLAFLIAAFATFTSLFYSEVVHYPPCSLCWYQRIFLFPQFILLGIAYSKKDKNISDYSLILSVVGGLIALYQILLQFGVTSYTPCSLTSAVSCAEKYFTFYGYITIPVMSLTAFVLLLITMGVIKYKNR